MGNPPPGVPPPRLQELERNLQEAAESHQEINARAFVKLKMTKKPEGNDSA